MRTRAIREGLDRYDPLLLSLDDQLARLREYNRNYWDSRLTDEQLAVVDVSGDITQRVDDLTTFHVQFGSLEETGEMLWRVYVGEQGGHGHWTWPERQFDGKHLLGLLGSNVRQYEPGIHRVRINLVAHWEPEGGRTLEEVREGAKGTDEILAQLEVLSAYGLHSELFREQDGKNLPYSDMPGTDVLVPGFTRSYALSVCSSSSDHRARMHAAWVTHCSNWWAAPVLLE